jgi:Immune inhibitor A-like, MAM domain
MLLAALALGPAAAWPQAQPNESQEPDYYRIESELESWRAQNGTSWLVVHDEQTGWGRFLYGGSTAAAFAPRSDADWTALAERALQSTKAIHGMEQSTLVLERVMFLPLGSAGSTDKVTVNYRQQVGSVPVLGGSVSLLFDLSGRLLSVDTTGMPGLSNSFPTLPAIEAGSAVDSALSLFSQDTGLPPTSVESPELVIEQVVQGKFRQPRLAWQVGVHFRSEGSAPAGTVYRIDALNGALLSKRDAIHYFDVSGTVRSMATAGNFPDSATNPEQQIVMPYLRVTSASGNATTDSNGNFTIVGATAPLSVTLTYNGTYCTTNNQAQADYTLTTTLNSASGNQVLMNPAAPEFVTAEANGHNWIGKMRDWTRSINPADPTSDFLATCNVNLNQTCNAYYDGVSVNFYRLGGGCANTAYSSVVLHEMGHWLNDRYGSGNGGDGFGEGNADNFSTYILDDPIVGHDFCGAGCNVRDGNNNRMFCGDCCGGCYGEVHADGEVLMGAIWKVRKRLKTTLGNAPGVLTSSTLFNGWMNAYNDAQIKSIIENHWLTLDDNDGNINNGTPHYADIDGGFKDQGFPGFQLSFVNFANVTTLGNTTNEVGPYAVDATITATFNPPVSQQRLFYRVNGGAFQQVNMTPLGGNNYRGLIPGQQSPAKVEYYLTAQDATAQSNSYPAAGAATPIKFYVGIVTTWYTNNFEGGTAGWTHGSPNGTQDDWQLSSQLGVNVSFGKSGDPTTAPSGTNIWGNDLGQTGWNGAYSDNVSNFLRSPAIDLSQATGTMLTLKRWLMVEKSQFDKATVKVNGQQVYINPSGSDQLDSSWVDMEIDISAIADHNPAVTIEFGLVTDQGLTYGGWNIDDVAITSIGSVCGSPTSYCTSKMTSALTIPVMGWSGTASQAAGNFVVNVSGTLNNVNSAVFFSPNQASSPFSGGTLCVGPPVTRGPLTKTSLSGTASFPVTITPAMVGTTINYQWWFRDPADPFGVGLSNGLSVTFCD